MEDLKPGTEAQREDGYLGTEIQEEEIPQDEEDDLEEEVKTECSETEDKHAWLVNMRRCCGVCRDSEEDIVSFPMREITTTKSLPNLDKPDAVSRCRLNTY